VGLDARGAHIGIDTRDDSLARSPVLPVLVAALVDELLRRAGIDAAREPFWTLDAGTDRDSEETGPRGAGDDIDRAVAFFGWAAAALAGLAGLLVFARR
jgi:hypothetical protein